jgi:hypothetical protein
MESDFPSVFNRMVFGEDNSACAVEPVFGQPGSGTIGGQANNLRVTQFSLNLKW